MTPTEEIALFQYELGQSITQWGYVEGQLLRIALSCVAMPDREALAIAYHSVENFRSKLAVCDGLVTHKHSTSKHYKRWVAVRDRVSKAAARRNKIAHGWQRLYVNNTPGRRWATVPLHHVDGKLLNSEGEKPPQGALCLRDISEIHGEFLALTTHLCNVHEQLCGRIAPFDLDQETQPLAQSIRSLRDKLRWQFGATPLPARRKRSQAKESRE